MPLIILRRNTKMVSRPQLVAIRNKVVSILSGLFQLEPREFEVWTDTVKRDDWNCPPLSVMLCTGPGKKKWRLRNRRAIAIKVSADLIDSGLMPTRWIGPEKSYFWIRISKGSFVPIGYPDKIR